MNKESDLVAKTIENDINTLVEDLNIVIKAHNVLVEENQQLKSTLEEIREYIKHEWFKRGQLGIIDKSFQEWELNNLLQIIDKGVNNE